MSDDQEIETVKANNNFFIPRADNTTLFKPPYKIQGRPRRITKERVRLKYIRGSIKDNELFDRDFRPKAINKKIRKIWKWIAGQERTRKSFEGISLSKISEKEYYVYEGIRRISALKHLGWEVIDVSVADFSYLKYNAPYPRTTSRPRQFNNYKPNEVESKPNNEISSDTIQIFAPRMTKPSEIQVDSKKRK